MAKFDMMEQVLTAVMAINNPRGATVSEITSFIKDRMDGLLGHRLSIVRDVRSVLSRGVRKGMLSRRGRGRYNMPTTHAAGQTSLL